MPRPYADYSLEVEDDRGARGGSGVCGGKLYARDCGHAESFDEFGSVDGMDLLRIPEREIVGCARDAGRFYGQRVAIRRPGFGEDAKARADFAQHRESGVVRETEIVFEANADGVGIGVQRNVTLDVLVGVVFGDVELRRMAVEFNAEDFSAQAESGREIERNIF
jgi:hypothetical protein